MQRFHAFLDVGDPLTGRDYAILDVFDEFSFVCVDPRLDFFLAVANYKLEFLLALINQPLAQVFQVDLVGIP